MKRILSILFLTILSSTSFANNYLSARELNENCSDSNGAFRLACSSYIAGYFDGLSAGQCTRFKKGITVGTLINIFTRDMSVHPEKGDEPADVVLSQLLMKHNIANIK